MAKSDIIVIERALLTSKAFRTLTGTAKTVYFDFRMKCQIKGVKRKQGAKSQRIILNNGEIEYTYSEAEKKKPRIPRATFMRKIDELLAHGLIDIHHSGSGGKKGDKSLFGISERWRKYGKSDFIIAERPKDYRCKRGFASGADHWRKKQS